MSVQITSLDRDDLPASLLSLAKIHLRVDDSTTDEYIRGCMRRAIGAIEDRKGVAINPATVIWTPASSEFNSAGATLPAGCSTAHDFTATSGSPPADCSANYSLQLKWNDITGVPIKILAGAAATALTVTLQVGFDDESLPPQLLDLILRDTAHLYEHREILLPGSSYVAPDLELDQTWWMPRV